MENKYLNIKGVLQFLIIILFITACNQKHKEENVKHEYPAYFIKSWMDGCIEGNNNIEQTLLCSCLIEKIQKKYTYIEIQKIGNRKGKEYDEYEIFLKKAAKDCIQESIKK